MTDLIADLPRPPVPKFVADGNLPLPPRQCEARRSRLDDEVSADRRYRTLFRTGEGYIKEMPSATFEDCVVIPSGMYAAAPPMKLPPPRPDALPVPLDAYEESIMRHVFGPMKLGKGGA